MVQQLPLASCKCGQRIIEAASQALQLVLIGAVAPIVGGAGAVGVTLFSAGVIGQLESLPTAGPSNAIITSLLWIPAGVLVTLLLHVTSAGKDATNWTYYPTAVLLIVAVMFPTAMVDAFVRKARHKRRKIEASQEIHHGKNIEILHDQQLVLMRRLKSMQGETSA